MSNSINYLYFNSSALFCPGVHDAIKMTLTAVYKKPHSSDQSCCTNNPMSVHLSPLLCYCVLIGGGPPTRTILSVLSDIG